MASPWPNAPASFGFEDTGEEKSGSEVETYNTNSPFSQPSRGHFRSQSITDQLSKTPRVTPNWGHSLSKSYGGNDWPLPASDSSTAVSTPASAITANVRTPMFSTPASNDPLWTDQSNGPKKRGPKPKNEPAATRRQQLNRIAQRAHRDRKEFYIKNLESEVKRFRTAYTASLADRQRLVTENRLLREEVAAFRAMAGLPAEDVLMTQAAYSLPPPQPLQPAPQFANPALISPPRPVSQPPSESSPKGLKSMFNKLKKKDSTGGIRISPPMQSLNEFENLDISGNSGIGGVQTGQVFPPSPPFGGSQSPEPTQFGHNRTTSNTTMSTLHDQGMEQSLAAVALQFIVRLEAVCLDHLHAANQSDLDPESAPHGHALMGSSISYASPTPTTLSSPQTVSAYGSSTGSPGGPTMDQRTLEVLLNLNFQTNNGEFINTLGGPIYGSISVLDAWNLVSSHTKFGKFDLDSVASRLSGKVVCRGYGPVVEAEDVFNAIDEVTAGQGYGRF